MGIYRFVLTILWIIICSSIGVFFRYYFGISVLGALPAVILSLPCFYVVRLIWSGRFDIRKKSSNPKPTGGFNGSNITSQTVYKTTDGSSSSVSAPSARIKTYVECPACGLMIAKGRSSCDCGYDLTPPSKKFFKKFFRIFVPVVLCAVLFVGGFFAGRYSMQPEVEAARQSGYDRGHDAGFSAGDLAGYNRGLSEGYQNGFDSASGNSDHVYINGGKTYHYSKTCAGMGLMPDPVLIDKVDAVLSGYGPCMLCRNSAPPKLTIKNPVISNISPKSSGGKLVPIN